MNELELIVSLFPIVFMLHEFEEIIGFKTWVIKDGLWIAKKYPKVAKQISIYERLSVPAFALAVLEEFILIGIVTALALTLQWYSVWIAVFLGFSLHIFIHIGQWMMVISPLLLHRFYLYPIFFGEHTKFSRNFL